MSASSTVLSVLVKTTPSATTAATVYTVAASKAVKLATATVTNTHTSSSAVFDIYINGTAKGDAVVYQYSLLAGDTISLTDILGGMSLDETNTIGFKTSLANDTNLIVTGALLSA
jgi:hypothetical protein